MLILAGLNGEMLLVFKRLNWSTTTMTEGLSGNRVSQGDNGNLYKQTLLVQAKAKVKLLCYSLKIDSRFRQERLHSITE